jgi:phosphonate transport system substrate-binding protein
MCRMRRLMVVLVMLLSSVSSALAADPTWPKELTFALLSTESAPEVGRRWTPVLEQLSQDLGLPVKQVAASDYRGSIEALKFNKAQIGQLGPKGYVEASNNNYANVEPIAQLQHANGSLGYRSCLIVHADSDLFSPEDITSKTFAFNDPNSTSGYLVPMTFFLMEMSIDSVWSERLRRRRPAFFLMEMSIDPKEHFSKLTFSGSHEASILAVANKKVDVGSTNLPDIQQMTREGKIPRGTVRVIWVSKLIPNDPIVVRKDLPDSLKQTIQQSLTTMKAKNPEVFVAGGAWIGGFVKVDDAAYQIIRDLNETTKRLAALK